MATMMLAPHVATAQNVPTSITLWGNIRLGMSDAQVRKALPSAKLADDGKTIDGGETRLAGQPFKVYVAMSASKADQVSLVGSGYALQEVRLALNNKYGKAAESFRCSDMGGIEICNASWLTQAGLKVSLTQMSSTTGSALTIKYERVDLSGV